MVVLYTSGQYNSTTVDLQQITGVLETLDLEYLQILVRLYLISLVMRMQFVNVHMKPKVRYSTSLVLMRR